VTIYLRDDWADTSWEDLPFGVRVELRNFDGIAAIAADRAGADYSRRCEDDGTAFDQAEYDFVYWSTYAERVLVAWEGVRLSGGGADQGDAPVTPETIRLFMRQLGMGNLLRRLLLIRHGRLEEEKNAPSDSASGTTMLPVEPDIVLDAA
jgi:hypothetical protein